MKTQTLKKIEPEYNNAFIVAKSFNGCCGDVISYMYFKTLNLLPEEFYNLLDEEYDEEEMQEIQLDYIQTKDFLKSTSNLDMIDTICEFIQKEALEEKLITSYGKFCLADSLKYDCKFIYKSILSYYNEEKKGSMRDELFY